MPLYYQMPTFIDNLKPMSVISPVKCNAPSLADSLLGHHRNIKANKNKMQCPVTDTTCGPLCNVETVHIHWYIRTSKFDR